MVCGLLVLYHDDCIVHCFGNYISLAQIMPSLSIPNQKSGRPTCKGIQAYRLCGTGIARFGCLRNYSGQLFSSTKCTASSGFGFHSFGIVEKITLLSELSGQQ